MKTVRRRVDVNLEELDRVLDGARHAPLSEADYDKLKGALHALAAMLVRPRNTEKTKAVLEESESSEPGAETPPMPARDELIRQAAQGEVLHNDDTSISSAAAR